MNTARVVMRMKPRAERANTAQEIVAQTRPLLARFPGFRTFVTLPPALQIGGRQGDSTYSVTLRSPDTTQLYDWAGRFQQAIAQLPLVQDVSSDLEIKSPRARLVIDRDKAAAMALDPARDLRRALQRLRTALVVDDLRRRSAVPRPAGARPAVSDDDRRARPPGVQDAARRDGPARLGGAHDARTSVRRPSTIPASCRRSRSPSACGPVLRWAMPSTTSARSARRCFQRR